MEAIFRNGPSALIIMTMILFGLSKKIGKASMWHYIGVMLNTMVLIIIFDIVGVSPMSGFHTDINLSKVNLIPFVEMVNSTIETCKTEGLSPLISSEVLAINFVGNVLLFMPFGFLYPLLWRKNQKLIKTVLVGACLSLFIECWQLFLLRATDIDDLILNNCGAIAGYFAFLLFRRLFPHFSAKFMLQDKLTATAWRFVPFICVAVTFLITVCFGFYDRSIYL